MADHGFLRIRNKHGQSFVLFSKLVKATRKGNLDEIRELVKRGVKLNAIEAGITPLHVAAARNFVDCVEFLLKNGAKVNQTITGQVTALHTASRLGNLASVVVLVTYGADVNALNAEGWSSVHLAARHGKTKCLRILINSGGHVNGTMQPSLNPHAVEHECIPLFLATQYGHSECVDVLLKLGANINTQSDINSKLSALHLAVKHGHMQCVYMILWRGANVNATDKAGNTPLHLAAHNGDTQMTELLLQAGANADQCNDSQRRAVDIAPEGPAKCLLDSLQRSTMSLSFLCVRCIRLAFRSNCIEDAVLSLPLPYMLQKKLLLTDSVRYF